MSTSGTTIWTATRDQIIKGALRKLAVLPSGGVPSTNQINDAADALNALIKAFQAEGMPVWKITSKTLTTVAGNSTYTIGPAVTPSTTQFVGAQPLKVIEAFYTTLGGNNTPMNVYNRYDFMQLPQSGASGTPLNVYCQPLATGNTTVMVWPTPVDSTTTITLHYEATLEDVSASTDNVDFPAYWIQALVYNLAWTLAPEYGIPPSDRTLLAGEAKYWAQEALSYGSEEGSIYLSPRSH